MDKEHTDETPALEFPSDIKPDLPAASLESMEDKVSTIPQPEVAAQQQPLDQTGVIQLVLTDEGKEHPEGDPQADPTQAANYSLVQAGQLAEGEYGTVVNGQPIQPYPTGMLAAAVQQPSTYSSQSTGWMMDGMGTPAAEIPPASTMMNGPNMTRALTLGYGSQTTTFYQMPTYSQFGVGFVYGNTWEGEPVDESMPPGKHGNYIVTADHRQFQILASISDSRVGQLHLLNTGDNDPSTALKVMQNTIPNRYRSAVHYVHKMFVCEFVDKKFYVQACEVGAEKFSGGTSTLAWTNALRHYCPQRTSCRLSGPLYFGFAIPAVQELCPNLKYQPRKTGVRGPRRHSQAYQEDDVEGTEDVQSMGVQSVVLPDTQLAPQTLDQLATNNAAYAAQALPSPPQVLNAASIPATLTTTFAITIPPAARTIEQITELPPTEQLEEPSYLDEDIKTRGG